MKRNPYKMIERAVVTLLVAAMVFVVLGTIHLTHSWKGVGIVLSVVIVIGFVCFFVDWWASKRNAWDRKHDPRY